MTHKQLHGKSYVYALCTGNAMRTNTWLYPAYTSSSQMSEPLVLETLELAPYELGLGWGWNELELQLVTH